MCILSQKYGKQFILSHENIIFFFPALNYITYSDFLRVSWCIMGVCSASPSGKICAPTGEIFRAHGKVKIASDEK
jgi:hypothetical protein